MATTSRDRSHDLFSDPVRRAGDLRGALPHGGDTPNGDLGALNGKAAGSDAAVPLSCDSIPPEALADARGSFDLVGFLCFAVTLVGMLGTIALLWAVTP